ncbi:MAG: hypothetical protein Q7R52_04660 [archaeon]|nr:hypothetical protein [archaeon]
MLLKILGIIDILSGFMLLLLGFGLNISKIVLIIFGILLLIKSSLGFFKEIGSWIDLLSGIALIIGIFLDIGWINFIFSILMFQKGIFSFL